MFGQGYTHTALSFSIPNPGSAPYTSGYNDRAYPNPNGNYQAVYRPQPIDMTPARAAVKSDADSNNLTSQLATILHESFNIEPKGRERVNQKPYLGYYDQLPYPRGYRVHKFSKFSREDGKSTLEHVSQFIL
jgi:hypothetical protein